jgi:hypothetical protein
MEFDAFRRTFINDFAVAQLVAAALSKSESPPVALKSP